MSIGGSSYQAVDSYLAIFREATWGTLQHSAATNATAIEFLSCNVKTAIKSESLNTLGFRGKTKRVQLEKSVAGSLETHLSPTESPLLMAVGLGGSIVTTSITGAFAHSLTVGDVVTSSIPSVSFNFMKGKTAWNYVGGRVDSMVISANVGEVAKITYEMIFKDSTIGATDIQSSLSYTSVLPFTFVNGVYRYNSTEAAADTTTAQECILGFELTVNNNLKSDTDARCLGSNIIAVLPPTRREIEFKVRQRFDTTTTYSRFTSGTVGSVELKFTGASITAEYNQDMEIRLPKVYYKTGDTEVTSPEDLLTTELDFDVLLDTMTSSGREMGVTIINNVNSYTSL